MTIEETLNRIKQSLDKNASKQKRLKEEADAMRLTAEVLQRDHALPKTPTTPDIDLSAEALDDYLMLAGESMGVVGVTQVARLVLAREQQPDTYSNVVNLRTRVQKRLKRRPDFVKIGRGQYQYSPGQIDGQGDCGEHSDCGGECESFRERFGRAM